MSGKCPYCNIEHDEILDNITDEASDMAEEFTDKSFNKIWSFGMASVMAESMSKEELAKMMFHTGATQMLIDYLMSEHENKCSHKG